MAMKFVGSLCLSDIPKSEIKVIKCKDGKERAFLSISVHENKEASYSAEGKLISDHFISCAPKKEERVEGTQYIFGNLRTWTQVEQPAQPSAEEIAEAPSIESIDGSLELPLL